MLVKIKDKNLYYVGGVVRDNYLNCQSKDVDYCYEGDAIEFTKSWNVIKTNSDFGTVKVLFDGEEIDIASTRVEEYPKAGHLPVVTQIGCPIIKDLERRDFTINAMARNTITGEVIDYFNGQDDLKYKKIRVLHEKSFIDDPSRIIRALKFSVRFGFELDENTKKLQDTYLENVNYDMSYYRLKKELIDSFNLNNNRIYELFNEQKLYRLINKNATNPNIKGDLVGLINKFNPKLKYMVFLSLFDLDNFELTSEEKFIKISYDSIRNFYSNDDYEIYKIFNDIPLESVLAYAVSVDNKIAMKYLEKLKDIKISITSYDLIDMKIPQGKIYQEIFDFLLEKKIQNPDLTLEEEKFLIKRFFLC